METQLEYERRPSTAAFMLRALYPPVLRRRGRFPSLSASWKGHRVERARLEELLRITSLRGAGSLPLLYPHVFGFPLQMVILTHPAFPLPIWRVLQIRNHLLQHRPIPAEAVLDLETRVGGQRVLEKGVEVDLYTTVHLEKQLAWESLNTFYYRGRFGDARPPSPTAAAPEVGEDAVARWRTPAGGGWRFAALTGDYNGIHWSRRYARALGFQRAFHHPQLVLGQALARIPAARTGEPQRLETWLKGPVYHGSEVTLRVSVGPGGTAFAVVPEGERRPAIVGRWCSVASGSRPLGDLVGP